VLRAAVDDELDWPPQLVHGSNPADVFVWDRALAPLQVSVLQVSGVRLDCLPSCLSIYQYFKKPTEVMTTAMRMVLCECLAAQFSLYALTEEASGEIEDALAHDRGVELSDIDFGPVELCEFAMARIKSGWCPVWLLQTYATIANVTVWLIQTQQSIPHRIDPQSVEGRDAPSQHMVLLFTCPADDGPDYGHFSLVVGTGNHDNWLRTTMSKQVRDLLASAGVESLEPRTKRACRGANVDPQSGPGGDTPQLDEWRQACIQAGLHQEIEAWQRVCKEATSSGTNMVTSPDADNGACSAAADENPTVEVVAAGCWMSVG